MLLYPVLEELVPRQEDRLEFPCLGLDLDSPRTAFLGPG